ncbi:uncharacterized protein Z518_04430 [Rhinocladiella mackenziei CBS 650.93]|uniref:Uncharacterized protein n=1 Tax=Rhinocladiella mackenziei CBS 650.93 TaxID=1442369 RepID=A0A0D2IL77_9EURO|nr:uncharacterized protein Z518_04430 [Rhinocladiella mackenziei CBS 650.93]KIX06454.1 hypothetical protein Z518_04430 [Rhinocladiella mackenziei CBS 650.93]
MEYKEAQRQNDIITRDFAYPEAGSFTTPIASTASSEDIATPELTEAIEKKNDQAKSSSFVANKLSYTRYYNPAWTVSQESSLSTHPSTSSTFALPMHALPTPHLTSDNFISEHIQHDSGESNFSKYSTAHGGPGSYSRSRPGLDTIQSGVAMDNTISSTINAQSPLENRESRESKASSSNFSQYSVMCSPSEPEGSKNLDWTKRRSNR